MKLKLISTLFISVLAIAYFLPQEKIQTKPLKQFVKKKEEPKRYDQPDKAVAWLEQFRRNKDKSVSKAQLNQRIKRQTLAKEMAFKSVDKGATNNMPLFTFDNLGPSNFGGRTRAFVIKPDDDNYLLAGSVTGGIFKSTDAATSWHPVVDFLPSIAIGSMVVDPDDNNRVYAGTGEGYFNYYSAQGAGIFVSEDFGDTWTQLPSTDNENFYFVNRMVRVPNSDILLAATRKGIFRSTDLGQSWDEVSGYDTKSRGFVDMKIDPSDSNNILAVHYGNANDSIELTVSNPANVSGVYDAILAGFGPAFTTTGTGNKDIVVVNDGVAPNNDGCEPISTVLTGKIALIQRGKCFFVDKVKNAQLKGAIAVIVYQNLDDDAFIMGGDDSTISIPSAMISKADGEILATAAGVKGEIKSILASPLQRFLMKSNDKGATWQMLNANKGLPVSNVGRMEVAIGNDGVAYMIADDGRGIDTRGLWRADNINSQFNKTASNTLFLDRFNDLSEKTQGWYDLALAVSPVNSNKVFMGGIDQYVSNNSGASINLNSYWASFLSGFQPNKFLHADHHGYYFSQQHPNILYVISDGGVFKSTDGGQSYISANDGLSISQSYGIAVRKDGKRISSGTQDNGSQLYFGDSNTWLEWQGGDGGFSGWDQQQSNYVYGSYIRGVMYGSRNGGLTVEYFFDNEDPIKDGAAFIQPFVLDKNNGNRMLIGMNRVIYSNNIRQLRNANFSVVSGDIGTLSAVNFNDALTTQALAGNTYGNVFKIDNVGSLNNLTDISPANVSGAITDIKADTNDTTGKTLYLTRGDYDSDRILKSTNGGASWTSISGDLPDMPLFQVSIDPKDSNQIYVGSELGLWTAKLDSGTPHWQRYEYGLAFTRVIDLVWNNDDTLYIGTHGRGTFKASRSALEISLNKFITTDSNHDNDGVLDRGETGLLMLNIKNNTSHEILDASLDLSQQGINIDSSMPIVINRIAAFENKVVPVKVSLANDAACNTDISVDVNVSYADGISHSTFAVITAADNNQVNTDFIADAESNDIYMTKSLLLGNSAWRKDTTAAFSGSASWFTIDEGNPSDKSLTSPWLIMNGGGNTLSFSLKYFTQISSNQLNDGVLLEMREKGGLWHDIGHLSSINYDNRLPLNSTARARFAWGGSHNSWRTATVNLAENYKGKTIQFRFRMISDSNTGSTGFWVDDIKMTNVIWQKNTTCDEVVSTDGKIPNSGLWYDKSRNGHGFVVEPIGDSGLYFTVFYTYDDDGKPEWYTSLTTLENGVLNADFTNETLQRFIYDHNTNTNALDSSITEGRLSIDFNSTTVATSAACQDGTDRNLEQVALAHWKINGQEGSWCITPIIAEENKGYPDLGGTWYAGSADQGWGLSLALAKQQLISIIYYYDQSGQPRWAIGDAGNFMQGENISLSMREASGFGRTDTPIAPTYTDAGTMDLTLNHVLNNLQIDGTGTFNVQYQGSEGGSWNRNNIPIQIITNTH